MPLPLTPALPRSNSKHAYKSSAKNCTPACRTTTSPPYNCLPPRLAKNCAKDKACSTKAGTSCRWRTTSKPTDWRTPNNPSTPSNKSHDATPANTPSAPTCGTGTNRPCNASPSGHNPPATTCAASPPKASARACPGRHATSPLSRTRNPSSASSTYSTTTPRPTSAPPSPTTSTTSAKTIPPSPTTPPPAGWRKATATRPAGSSTKACAASSRRAIPKLWP